MRVHGSATGGLLGGRPLSRLSTSILQSALNTIQQSSFPGPLRPSTRPPGREVVAVEQGQLQWGAMELKKLRQIAAEYNTTIASQARAIRVLSEAGETASSEIRELMNEVAARKAEVDSLKDSQHTAIGRIAALDAELQTLTEAKAEAVVEAALSRRELAAACESRADLSRQLVACQAELAAAKGEVAAAREWLADAQATHQEELQSERLLTVKAMAEQGDAEAEAAKLRGELAACRADLAAADERLESALDEYDLEEVLLQERRAFKEAMDKEVAAACRDAVFEAKVQSTRRLQQQKAAMRELRQRNLALEAVVAAGGNRRYAMQERIDALLAGARPKVSASTQTMSQAGAALDGALLQPETPDTGAAEAADALWGVHDKVQAMVLMPRTYAPKYGRLSVDVSLEHDDPDAPPAAAAAAAADQAGAAGSVALQPQANGAQRRQQSPVRQAHHSSWCGSVAAPVQPSQPGTWQALVLHLGATEHSSSGGHGGAQLGSPQLQPHFSSASGSSLAAPVLQQSEQRCALDELMSLCLPPAAACQQGGSEAADAAVVVRRGQWGSDDAASCVVLDIGRRSSFWS